MYPISLYAIVQHQMSGEKFVAVFESKDSSKITAISQALHYSEVERIKEGKQDIDDVPVSEEDTAWANSQPWNVK